MTEQEAYQEHIRYTRDTYCRIVIRHAYFDAAPYAGGGGGNGKSPLNI